MKIIDSYDHPDFDAVRVDFYQNFSPDDWDFIVVAGGPEKWASRPEVIYVCRKIHPSACFVDVKRIGDWVIGVTYHS